MIIISSNSSSSSSSCSSSSSSVSMIITGEVPRARLHGQDLHELHGRQAGREVHGVQELGNI